MHVAYGLEDPRDHLYHYIGITNNVYARFIQHITGDGGNIEKNGWIWECRQENIMIIMREFQRMEELEEAQERERFWIRYYLHLGHPLHNLAIAKGITKTMQEIERQHAVLEKEQKIIAPLPVINPQREEITLNDAIQAWNEGHTSVTKLEKTLEVSHHKAYRLYKQIQEASQQSA